MGNRAVQKKHFFFEFNPLPPQIVRLMIETPHTKFQLIRSTGRGGHAIWNFEFSLIFAHFSINFLSQNTWYLSFFWFSIAQITYYTQSKPGCSVCFVNLLTKNFLFFRYFD